MKGEYKLKSLLSTLEEIATQLPKETKSTRPLEEEKDAKNKREGDPSSGNLADFPIAHSTNARFLQRTLTEIKTLHGASNRSPLHSNLQTLMNDLSEVQKEDVMEVTENINTVISSLYRRIECDLDTLITVEKSWDMFGESTRDTMWIGGDHDVEKTKEGMMEKGLGTQAQYFVFEGFLRRLYEGLKEVVGGDTAGSMYATP